jgi:hypothetical protein
MSFFSFTESENRKAEQVLSRGLVPVGGGCGEMVKVGEYGTNTVYTFI